MPINPISPNRQMCNLPKRVSNAAKKKVIASAVAEKRQQVQSKDLVLEELSKLKELLISDPNNEYSRELLEEKMQLLSDTNYIW